MLIILDQLLNKNFLARGEVNLLQPNEKKSLPANRRQLDWKAPLTPASGPLKWSPGDRASTILPIWLMAFYSSAGCEPTGQPWEQNSPAWKGCGTRMRCAQAWRCTALALGTASGWALRCSGRGAATQRDAMPSGWIPPVNKWFVFLSPVNEGVPLINSPSPWWWQKFSQEMYWTNL